MTILGKNFSLQKVLPWLLVIGGLIGIAASLILVYDQIRIWENPSFQPACDLNPIVSCGTVISSKQGEIFGIPAPILGLLAFPALVVVGAALLAGTKLKRWFWLGLQAGVIGGVGFALWLFWLSLYKVHALCPFCLTVDVVVYTLAWYVTLYNIQTKVIVLKGTWQKIGFFARRHHLDILLFWFLLVAIYILHHFWYYFGRHIHL